MRRNPRTEAEIRTLLQKWGSTLPADKKAKFANMMAFLDADATSASAFFGAVSAKIDKIEAKKEAARAEKEASAQAAKAQEAANVPVTAVSPEPRTGGALTDRQGWTEMAALVDSALSDLTSDEREAIKAAFLEHAAA